jgi:hypothetical protein
MALKARQRRALPQKAEGGSADEPALGRMSYGRLAAGRINATMQSAPLLFPGASAWQASCEPAASAAPLAGLPGNVMRASGARTLAPLCLVFALRYLFAPRPGRRSTPSMQMGYGSAFLHFKGCVGKYFSRERCLGSLYSVYGQTGAAPSTARARRAARGCGTEHPAGLP